MKALILAGPFLPARRSSLSLRAARWSPLRVDAGVEAGSADRGLAPCHSSVPGYSERCLTPPPPRLPMTLLLHYATPPPTALWVMAERQCCVGLGNV